jgi:beta-phosphoglucomutase-like phosphatase (HAD superfamily)
LGYSWFVQFWLKLYLLYANPAISDETVTKAKRLMEAGRINHADVIHGAKDGVRRLNQMGFRLVVVTAREKEEMEESRRWLAEHFGGMVSISETILSNIHGFERIN